MFQVDGVKSKFGLFIEQIEKTTSKMKMTSNEDDLKNEDDLDNEDDAGVQCTCTCSAIRGELALPHTKIDTTIHIACQHSKQLKNNICLVNIFWKVRFQDSTLHSYLSNNISPDLAVWTTFVISAKRITFKWP